MPLIREVSLVRVDTVIHLNIHALSDLAQLYEFLAAVNASPGSSFRDAGPKVAGCDRTLSVIAARTIWLNARSTGGAIVADDAADAARSCR
ncbi:MAG: hypothetical protein ACREXS_09525 [Gammaproteobacteria bacterium]